MEREARQDLRSLAAAVRRAEQRAALDTLGVRWGERTERWENQLERLLQFRERYGHVHVPSTFRGDPALARWVVKQRVRYREGTLELGTAPATPGARTLGDRGPLGGALPSARALRLGARARTRAGERDCGASLWTRVQRRLERTGTLARPRAAPEGAAVLLGTARERLAGAARRARVSSWPLRRPALGPATPRPGFVGCLAATREATGPTLPRARASAGGAGLYLEPPRDASRRGPFRPANAGRTPPPGRTRAGRTTVLSVRGAE
jgi:hypothetical protein